MEHKPYLLVVDDNPENLKILGNLLQGEDYRLAFALNGNQALQSLEQALPDLVLLDVMMPELDGFEVCRQIKANPNTSQVPILFLTAKADTASVVEGFEAGGADYVAKPFNPKELLVRIHNQLTIKTSRETIELQKQELEKANHMQKELLHVLCHDLANPLGNIRSLAELIEAEPEFTRQGLEVVKRSAQQGMDTIDLIRRMRMAQEFFLQLEPVDLSMALQTAGEMMTGKLVKKEIQLQVNCPPILVRAEPVALVTSVLNNLLTNAIKFSYPQSSVEIRVWAEDPWVKLCVSDKGIGMPANMVPQLFDISVRTSRPGTQREEGTGFGMPLIKEFMTAFGGGIEVESKSETDFPTDHGTQVTLRFFPA